MLANMASCTSVTILQKDEETLAQAKARPSAQNRLFLLTISLYFASYIRDALVTGF